MDKKAEEIIDKSFVIFKDLRNIIDEQSETIKTQSEIIKMLDSLAKSQLENYKELLNVSITKGKFDK